MVQKEMVTEEVKKLPYKSLKYIVISVGTNDLDEKDHEQVLGELELLVHDIRRKFIGIKFVINELLPRKDHRNNEVGKFNLGLRNFDTYPDVTIASQQSIKDMSMLYDTKHLLESKVPIYAKNIIIAMLKAYGIKDKRELFVNPGGLQRTQSSGRSGNIQDRIMNLADYNGEERNHFSRVNQKKQFINENRGNIDNKNNESVIRNAIMQFGDVLLKCIQR